MSISRTLRRCTVVAVLGVASAACGGDSTAVPPQATIEPPSTDLPRFGAAVGADSATYDFEIPVGANAALAAGTPMTILPESIDARVGQTIRIVNNDLHGHTIGPWFIGPRETLLQEFTSEGSYEGTCTVNPSGGFVLVVRA